MCHINKNMRKDVEKEGLIFESSMHISPFGWIFVWIDVTVFCKKAFVQRDKSHYNISQPQTTIPNPTTNHFRTSLTQQMSVTTVLWRTICRMVTKSESSNELSYFIEEAEECAIWGISIIERKNILRLNFFFFLGRWKQDKWPFSRRIHKSLLCFRNCVGRRCVRKWMRAKPSSNSTRKYFQENGSAPCSVLVKTRGKKKSHRGVQCIKGRRCNKYVAVNVKVWPFEASRDIKCLQGWRYRASPRSVTQGQLQTDTV